ncbi:MAG: tetrahydrofolate dehydrogenase/cyclohydrolase catalytic domain-containing protein [Acidimicrobiales bacterium]
MRAVLFDGRRVRDEILADLRREIELAGSPPVTLGTIVVGDDPTGRSYIEYKHRAAAQAGMQATGVTLAETASQAELDDAVEAMGADPSVHGVFLQVPLPDHLDAATALAAWWASH